jgi:hypothetical protein
MANEIEIETLPVETVVRPDIPKLIARLRKGPLYVEHTYNLLTSHLRVAIKEQTGNDLSVREMMVLREGKLAPLFELTLKEK